VQYEVVVLDVACLVLIGQWRQLQMHRACHPPKAVLRVLRLAAEAGEVDGMKMQALVAQLQEWTTGVADAGPY